MKTLLAIISAIMLTTTAQAGGLSDPIVQPPVTQVNLPLAEYEGGLTNRVICSNVPAGSRSVPGVFIHAVGYVVEAPYADDVTVDLAAVLPAGLSSKDDEELTIGLQQLGLYDFVLVTRPEDNEREEIVETVVQGPDQIVQTQLPRGEWDGTEREWRVTSMEGTNTVRIRTADDRPVDLRIGNHIIMSTSGQGEAYFDLPAGQKFGGIKLYDSTTGQPLRNSTVSTNGEILDKTIETIVPGQPQIRRDTIIVRTTSEGKWCR